MNAAIELLRSMRCEGAELWVQGGRLGYRVPRHLRHLLPRLAELRSELLVLLAGVREELPVGDSEAWEEELHRWALAHCVFRDRAWGGVVALHKDYVEWSHATGNIPPATLATFRQWIVWQGFTLTGSLVHGLVLAEDMKRR